jgi:hypothetical protein
MKKTIVLLLVMINSLVVFSQSANFPKGMAKGMEMMKAAQTAEDFIAAANHFERVSEAEEGQWLPLYWAAYNYLAAGFKIEKEDKKDEAYQKGIALTEKAEAINPEESEILTLKAYLKLMYISVNPMVRAANGSSEAMYILGKAKAFAPENPRPYLVEGQNTFYTPKFFGGGKEAALPILEEGATRFEKQDDKLLSAKFLPTWGKARCTMLIEECKK